MSRFSAVLALEDGSVFYGTSIGIEGESSGEVVFNTGMTGYQEILTDPSYARQIVTLTYPHIGNTGCNAEDFESSKAWAAGLVIRDLPLLASNFRSEQSLVEFLAAYNIVAIAEIDTRRLTRILRDKGAQNGCVVANSNGVGETQTKHALAQAKAFAGLAGMDLAREVSCAAPYDWRQSTWVLGEGHRTMGAEALPMHVVCFDFGVKKNILRMLVDRGCRVTVVPAQTPAADVLALKPDGVMLSNGPGDPEPCTYAIQAIQALLEANMPIFGICLGHQLLALACGASTLKMKFGHHGCNHPVQNLDDGTVMITSQNHGFAANEATLPVNLRLTHKSLFDGSVQGLEHREKPAFSFQGHPEASPGPHDVGKLFDRFIDSIQSAGEA